jgi:hypothetical protein
LKEAMPGSAKETTNPVATAAFLAGHNIVFDLVSGCRGYIIPSEGKAFSDPVLSDDGMQLAFTVRQDATCKTVMFNIGDKTHREFAFCADSSGASI